MIAPLLAFLLGATGAIAESAQEPRQGTAAERETFFRQQLLADPDSAIAYIGLAAAIVDAGRPQEGVVLLSKAGNRWLRRGEYDKAEAVLSAAVEIGPEEASLLAQLGRAQTLNRNHSSAAASLGRAIELGLRDPEVLAYFGTALWETGRPAAAEESFRQSLALQRSALGVYQLGRLLLWQGRYAEAVPLLREIAGVSANTDILVDLADAQRGAGEMESAIVTYRRVLGRAPEMIKAHYGLATALRASGDLAAAEQEFETVGRLHAASEQEARIQGLEKGEVARAAALLSSDQPNEAIRLLEGVSESVESLTLMARAYQRLGDVASGAAALERAVALDPANSELRRQLFELRRLEGEGDS